MPTPPSPESQRFFNLLADGQWHPYGEIRDRLASTIGPGRALRFYNDRLKYRRLYHGREEDAQDVALLSEDERIFYGQRGLAERSMIAWRRRAVEVSGEGDSKMIRRTPGHSVWGIPDVGETEPAGEGAAASPGEPESVQNGRVDLEVPPSPVLGSVLSAEGVHQHGCTPLCQHQVGEVEQEDWSPSVFDIEKPEEVDSDVSVPESALPQDEPDKRSDMALFSESEVRDIVRSEVEKALDAFQVGMEQYLRNQFLQLEGTIAAVAGMPWRAAGGQVRKTH